MRLVADSLSIDRGGRRIVDTVSFNAESGEALILTGPNGAGKTTLLRALAGFLPLAGGRVRLDQAGADGAPDAETEIGEQIHFIGHRDPGCGPIAWQPTGQFCAWCRHRADL